ncbi:MAG: Hsp20/alpha crystallin family protein [Terriglobales bacterium]
MLTARGERRLEKDIKEESFHRMERHYGVFSRSFTLPSAVDPDKIEANYAHGVLTIHLAKRAEARPKQVKVNATKALKADSQTARHFSLLPFQKGGKFPPLAEISAPGSKR